MTVSRRTGSGARTCVTILFLGPRAALSTGPGREGGATFRRSEGWLRRPVLTDPMVDERGRAVEGTVLGLLHGSTASDVSMSSLRCGDSHDTSFSLCDCGLDDPQPI